MKKGISTFFSLNRDTQDVLCESLYGPWRIMVVYGSERAATEAKTKTLQRQMDI